jgi:hypothetical protein
MHAWVVVLNINSFPKLIKLLLQCLTHILFIQRQPQNAGKLRALC